MNWAVEQGVVAVVAAGNSGTGVSSPACASRAIAVGALDASDTVPSWSSRGEALDVTAPGVDILSAYSCAAAGACPGTWYAKMSGTSMAAPHVAGTAALLLQGHPGFRPHEIYDVLMKTSLDLGTAGRDQLYGHGRVDALAAYAMANLLDPAQPDTGACLDVDGDGVGSCNDCQDLDASIYPGAPEMCNQKDDNCNAQVDEFCRAETPTKPKASCGNGVCEAPETIGSCAIDCTTIVPPRAAEMSDGRAGGTGAGTTAGGSGAQGGTQNSQGGTGGGSVGATGGTSRGNSAGGTGNGAAKAGR